MRILSPRSGSAVDSFWVNAAPADRTLLVAYAHPDDESFGSAGTLARYAAEDVAVHLDRIEQAWRCHASQLGDMSGMLRLPTPLRRCLPGGERFTRVAPPWPGGSPERDLFAGI
jgi:LmbE family N-acetylglucosaminyl deacetylase